MYCTSMMKISKDDVIAEFNRRKLFPHRWDKMKQKDVERKKLDYAELQEKRRQGDWGACSKIKEKYEKHWKIHRCYRERLKAIKAAASQLECDEIQSDGIATETCLSSTPLNQLHVNLESSKYILKYCNSLPV